MALVIVGSRHMNDTVFFFNLIFILKQLCSRMVPQSHHIIIFFFNSVSVGGGGRAEGGSTVD